MPRGEVGSKATASCGAGTERIHPQPPRKLRAWRCRNTSEIARSMRLRACGRAAELGRREAAVLKPCKKGGAGHAPQIPGRLLLRSPCRAGMAFQTDTGP